MSVKTSPRRAARQTAAKTVRALPSGWVAEESADYVGRRRRAD